jgi:hypothetical protein
VPQSLSFWEASSQIRLAPPLVAAAADLYSRHLHALWEKAEENNSKAKGSARQGKALCVHWRRADFKTYRPECLLSAFALFLFQTGVFFCAGFCDICRVTALLKVLRFSQSHVVLLPHPAAIGSASGARCTARDAGARRSCWYAPDRSSATQTNPSLSLAPSPLRLTRSHLRRARHHRR